MVGINDVIVTGPELSNSQAQGSQACQVPVSNSVSPPVSDSESEAGPSCDSGHGQLYLPRILSESSGSEAEAEDIHVTGENLGGFGIDRPENVEFSDHSESDSLDHVDSESESENETLHDALANWAIQFNVSHWVTGIFTRYFKKSSSRSSKRSQNFTQN